MKVKKEHAELFFIPLGALTFTVLIAVAAGAIWGVLEWLRNYGAAINPFPYFDKTTVLSVPFRVFSPDSLLGHVEDAINWYNTSFRGATRFGSGLGLIAGGFLSLNLARGKILACRVLTGAVCGLLIGARSALMLGSGAVFCLVGTVLGVVLAVVYMIYCGGKPTLPTLPLRTLPVPGQADASSQ